MVSNWSGDPLMEGVLMAEDECNHTTAWEWVYSIQPAYMSVICLLGMVGNTFVLCVFCLQRRHSTVADIYLGNLAAADLLMVSCLPFWVVAVVQEFHWPFGELMCQLVNIVIGMNYYCSVLFLTLVSVDRYLVLARPLSSQGRGRRPAWASGICLGVWVVGALLSLPALLFRSVQFFPHLGVEACYMAYPHDGWRLRYNLTINIVGFLVPVPIVSFCSYHIIRVLRDNQASRVRSTAAAGTERKAAHLVLIVLAIFILCWLPYQFVIFLDTLYHYEVISGCGWVDALDISTQLATYLGYSNSSLNPFLYVIVGKHFKQRAKGVCRQMMCCEKGRKSYHTVNLNSTIKYTDSTKV
ncbi:B2 bradykinin receptor-like [Coregonus clupeaformis]|uniref:B2 bradykinin receptor-like n=1 Tax=Coregonus clupeaformis TaxID=59861 RepID=UPI001BE0F521|nr:B2 bradykinin receptor-like [Coregonus clupeaformis]